MRLPRSDAERLVDLHESDQIYEILIEELYHTILKEGDAAIDGGAHIGLHTLPMAGCVGAEGRVFAFEPVPNLRQHLMHITQDMPAIVVQQKALGSEHGSATFHLFPDEPWYSSLVERQIGGEHRCETMEVEVVTMDGLADQPVRFIKLDLEGGEYAAIRGAKRLIEIQRPVIALECGRADGAHSGGYTADDYFGLFHAHGYEIRDLFGQPFGPAQFVLPWNDQTVPHYVVAAPVSRQNVFLGLTDRATAMLMMS